MSQANSAKEKDHSYRSDHSLGFAVIENRSVRKRSILLEIQQLSVAS